jgi:hypothetical protein
MGASVTANVIVWLLSSTDRIVRTTVLVSRRRNASGNNRAVAGKPCALSQIGLVEGEAGSSSNVEHVALRVRDEPLWAKASQPPRTVAHAVDFP